MIVVTGVTGNLGRLAAEDLLARVPAADVAVVARNPAAAKSFADRGVEVRHGDYDDPSTLGTAFAGANRLLFVSGSDITPGVRARQHQAVVDAAVDAGVGHVVYTSAITAPDAQGFLADHTITEAALRDSGLTHTLLRNSFYHHYFVNPGLAAAVDAGELTAPVIGHPLVTATIEDLALAASLVLTGDGHEDAAYELRGVPWTYEELAKTLSEVSGRPVRYRELTDDEVDPQTAFTLPFLRQLEFGEPTKDLENLLGRPPSSLADTVRRALDA
ncbi:NAD(P)H-binding protein [Phytoactinopolyspora mesophila]|nr:NAD(P)H-binding protein [Phytoactinopolyspora mesophila]